MLSKLREAIALYTANFVLFSQIILTVWLPASVLVVYLRYFVLPELTGGDEIAMLIQELEISNLIELIFGPIYAGALIYAFFRIKQGATVGYGVAMRHAAKRGLKLFATRFSTSLIIFLGLLALIIPGIILTLRYYFIDEIVVLENINSGNARKQSTRLTKGRRSQIFSVIILGWLGTFIIATMLTLASEIPIELFNLDITANFVTDVIIQSVNSILFGLLYAISFIFYWDSKQIDYYSQSSEADYIE